jgi:L-arabinokinase
LNAVEWVARVGTSDAARRDAEAFLARVVHAELFTHGRDIIVARAPGRLDVMGGIADYSGSLVLEWPLADGTFVALQRDTQPTLTIDCGLRYAQLRLPDLLSLNYHAARAFFAADAAQHWAAYVVGAFIVLAREHGVEFSAGARILVASTVPEGKGVSSSAALEVAAMMAICAAYDVTLERRDLALLCQKVENLIAGAPCGVMDQMTAALGESGQLLALLCQPAEVCGSLQLPRGLALWGIDSGIRHAVSGGDYVTVRAAAFMGRRILEDLLGRRLDYLANVTVGEFATLAARVPERLTGREFLGRYDGTSDRMTTVDPERVYPVRVATAHPIYEHARAREFAERLSSFEDADAQWTRSLAESAERLGTLMYESHASYSACGIGSDGTDALVAFVQCAGPGSGVYGAKITGGGSGGTVAIIGRTDAAPLVYAIAARYARRSGYAARVFDGSSHGAAASGVCDLRL